MDQGVRSGRARARHPVVNTLREWKLRCPKGKHGKLEFVFPTGAGEIEYHSNILQRGLEPAQIAAGIVDGKGKPKYALHALRHSYASWCINREKEGGFGFYHGRYGRSGRRMVPHPAWTTRPADQSRGTTPPF